VRKEKCNKKTIFNKSNNLLLTFIFLFIGLIYVDLPSGDRYENQVETFCWTLRILTHLAGLFGLGGIVFQYSVWKIVDNFWSTFHTL